MRLFVAVNLPAAETSRLAALLDELRSPDLPVRWLDAASIHITLKFLGEVAESLRPELAAALDRAAAGLSAFDVELGGVGAFPSRGRPRILWIGVAPSPRLAELHARVEQVTEPLGFAREQRSFQPHLTVGKIKANDRIGAAGMDRIAARVVYKANIRVGSIDLMRSHLGPRSASYEVLDRAMLENGTVT